MKKPRRHQKEAMPSRRFPYRGRYACSVARHTGDRNSATHPEERITEVEAGFLKMQVSRGDVIEVMEGDSKERNRLPSNVRMEIGPRWDTNYREINVIGQRAEEALEQVDKFLDSAALASVNRVRIIHGHGMGVLKRAVGEFLKTNPHVSRSYPAPPAEGGRGSYGSRASRMIKLLDSGMARFLIGIIGMAGLLMAPRNIAESIRRLASPSRCRITVIGWLAYVGRFVLA